ncbi:hypothetical protein EI94DRAFT_1744106 [Lactarius quietus]|nr:hypothetical protein EI94DRAFT_1744106 [Lactarius quietus]
MRHSRTREIVDRLRSAAIPRGRTRVSSTHGSDNPSTPAKNRQNGLNNTAVKQLFQKGSDGWICLADDAEDTAPKAKSPPGHDDGPPKPAEDSEPSDNEEVTFAALVPRPTRDTKRKPAAQSKYARRATGWAEGPPTATIAPTAMVPAPAPPRRGHGQRLAQSVQLAPPAAVGTFTFPPPAFYPFPGPLPQYAPAPVMTFGQPPFRGYPPRVGYPHASLPFAGALPHQQQHHIPQHHLYLHQQPPRPAYASVPVITGSTGIRHAQW